MPFVCAVCGVWCADAGAGAGGAAVGGRCRDSGISYGVVGSLKNVIKTMNNKLHNREIQNHSKICTE